MTKNGFRNLEGEVPEQVLGLRPAHSPSQGGGSAVLLQGGVGAELVAGEAQQEAEQERLAGEQVRQAELDLLEAVLAAKVVLLGAALADVVLALFLARAGVALLKGHWHGDCVTENYFTRIEILSVENLGMYHQYYPLHFEMGCRDKYNGRRNFGRGQQIGDLAYSANVAIKIIALMHLLSKKRGTTRRSLQAPLEEQVRG